ncbi:MAG: nitroreductase family protein [Eubacterium sp.]|nr:nitroreductase family protein [Eubacterium sp.]
MLEKDSVYRKRRSIRSFDADKAIAKEDLMLILEAGSYAPSGGNSQTTHRLVITDKEILARLEALVQQEFARMEIKEDTYKSIKNSILRSKQGNYYYDYQAPILIVMANKKGYGNAMADSAMMIQNMLLQATELGIGSCYINQLHWLDENPVIRGELLSLGLKEDETVTGGVALGYAKVWPEAELKRDGNPITFC